MIYKIYPQWIDKYAKVVYELVRTHDSRTHMPFNGFNFYPLFDDLWVERIYQAVKKFKESGLTMEGIIGLLPTHSSIKFNLLEMIIDLKTSNTEAKRAKLIIEFFMKAIRERAGSGDFWKDSRIKQYENVDEIIKKKMFIKADRSNAQEVAKITAGCGTLVYSLYNDFCTDFGYDVFGPYDISKKFGENSSLFVKQFIDLKPIDIWPEFNDFPYKTINIYAIYTGVESESGYLGCHMIYKQNLVDNLIYFLVEINNKFTASLDELRQIRNTILQTTSQFYVKYKDLGFEEHKRIWLWQLCYQFKNFFKKFEMDWQPSTEMIERVKNRELVDYVSTYDTTFEEFCDKFGINYLKSIYTL